MIPVPRLSSTRTSEFETVRVNFYSWDARRAALAPHLIKCVDILLTREKKVQEAEPLEFACCADAEQKQVLTESRLRIPSIGQCPVFGEPLYCVLSIIVVPGDAI